MLSMKLDTSAALRHFTRLGDLAPVAIARALNRAIGSGRTFMVREMSRDLRVRQHGVQQEIRVRHAHPWESQQSAALTVTGARIPVLNFAGRGRLPSRGQGPGASWSLQGQRRHRRQAFLAVMPNTGHRGIFKRLGPKERKSAGAWSKNLPIVELRGPSLPHVFAKFVPAGLARVSEQLTKRLAHEFRFYLDKVQMKVAA